MNTGDLEITDHMANLIQYELAQEIDRDMVKKIMVFNTTHQLPQINTKEPTPEELARFVKEQERIKEERFNRRYNELHQKFCRGELEGTLELEKSGVDSEYIDGFSLPDNELGEYIERWFYHNFVDETHFQIHYEFLRDTWVSIFSQKTLDCFKESFKKHLK